MAVMEELCPGCNHPIAIHVSQSVWDTRLMWHRSYRCPNCGAAIEEDGLDDTPTAIRRAILDAEGAWSLRVDEQGKRALLVMQALRQALGLSLTEAAKLRRQIPGTIMRGTRAEMERLKAVLAVENLTASVEAAREEADQEQ